MSRYGIASCGENRLHARSLANGRVKFEAPADQSGPFSHAEQADASRFPSARANCSDVKPSTVGHELRAVSRQHVSDPRVPSSQMFTGGM
jgi:hypothetical protein